MNVWLEAARPKTLPAAVTPVLVGTAAAATLDPLRFVLALVVAVMLQVAVNFANDYFDGVGGVDTAARTGPRRAVASGLVAPGQMRSAMFAALGVAAVAGGVLAVLVGWQLLLVGALAIAAALGYSGGPRPYASAGLGEVFVFVFFGVVATVGSQYVQDEAMAVAAVVASVPVGLLAVALLVVNNLRDIPTDVATGKYTLAVRLGDSGTRTLFVVLVLSSVLLGPGAIAATVTSSWPLLGVLVLPLVAPATRATRNGAVGRELIPVLETTGRTQLLFGLLVAAGLLLAG